MLLWESPTRQSWRKAGRACPVQPQAGSLIAIRKCLIQKMPESFFFSCGCTPPSISQESGLGLVLVWVFLYVHVIFFSFFDFVVVLIPKWKDLIGFQSRKHPIPALVFVFFISEVNHVGDTKGRYRAHQPPQCSVTYFYMNLASD